MFFLLILKNMHACCIYATSLAKVYKIRYLSDKPALLIYKQVL